MSANRARLTTLAQLVSAAAAMGAFDDLTVPTVVPSDPEHPGPVRFSDGREGHCCWANYMVSPETHNEDCGNAAKGGPDVR